MTPSKVKQLLIEAGYEYIGMPASELLDALADIGVLQHDGGLADASERDHNELLSLFDEYSSIEDWQ